MSSQDEHQAPVKSASNNELRLLTEVIDTPDITQRELSKRGGIALGLTNILMRNLTQKGYVRVAQASWKRRLYTLTPEGFSHRIRLMLTYVHKVLDHYQGVRQSLREQLEPLALNEESRVAICGTGELAELVYLGLKELSMNEIDFFDFKNTGDRRFLGGPVRDIASIDYNNYDRVVLAYLEPSETLIADLHGMGITPEQLVKLFADQKAKKR